MCLDLGKCKDGKCIPFCEREQQLESCACNGKGRPEHAVGEQCSLHTHRAWAWGFCAMETEPRALGVAAVSSKPPR